MKNLLLFLALLLNLSLSAQNYSIRGTVTDAADGVAIALTHLMRLAPRAHFAAGAR